MSNALLFKWESNNRGLDHKCGTCKTALSNPRAKKTCFGVHEEVCPKYHKTLFFLGNSHKCDACHKSNVLHDKRHREIASLVQIVLNLDDTRAGMSPSVHKARKAKKDKALESMILDTGFADEGTEPEEWLDASTVYDDDWDRRISGSTDSKENTDLEKMSKTERKTVKNRSQFQVSTTEELERIQDALHPAGDSLSHRGGGYLESNSLTNNATIDQNIAFNSHTFRYSSLRSAVHQKKLERSISTPRSRAPFDDSQMSAILHRLGISTDAVSPSSKERKSRLARLRSAIEKDLLCVENEDRETMTRMAGYWRYVNRRTYNAMVRNHELWDWATGAKLEEIEEEEEKELDGTDDEDQGSSPFSKSDTFTGPPQHESWDDDFLVESNDAVLATPVKTAAMDAKKEDMSPWAGIKDTRRLPRRSTSPPSPRKRDYPRAPLAPVRVLSLDTTTPSKYVPTKASVAAPNARTRTSLSTKLADLHFPKDPKGKPPPRRCECPIDLASIPATSASDRPRMDSAEGNGVPVDSPCHVTSEPQDDDTIRVPTSEVHANRNAPVSEPLTDPNNRFSLLMRSELE